MREKMSRKFKGLRNRNNRSESFENADTYQEPQVSLKNQVIDSLNADNRGEAREQDLNPAFNEGLEAEKGSVQMTLTEEKASPALDSLTARENTEGSAAELYPNGDDPDKVPVQTTLADDQVPNMPGAILKHARELLGLSQRELAFRLKTRINTVSDIEHDRLNQPTAVPFATAHIANYAKLVHIDPNPILELYRRNVARVAQMQERQEEEPQTDNSRKWLGYSFIGLVVVAGLVWWLLPQKQEESSTGALTITEEVPAKVNGQGDISFNVNESKTTTSVEGDKAPEVPASVDENTLRARQQAEALGNNEIEERTPVEGNLEQSQDKNAVLGSGAEIAAADAPLVRQDVKTASDGADNPFSMDYHKDSFKAPVAEDAAGDKTAAAATAEAKPEPKPEVKAQSAEESAATATAQPPAAAPAQDTAKPSEPAQAGTPASAETTKADTAKETAKAAGEEKEPVAVPLASKLNDITSSVRIKRSGGELASFSSISVKVRGPVSLKISDSRGKVLKQGSFKGGESVSAVGIPPLRVSLSDASQVSITYGGGTVVNAGGRQVTFELPVK